MGHDDDADDDGDDGDDDDDDYDVRVYMRRNEATKNTVNYCKHQINVFIVEWAVLLLLLLLLIEIVYFCLCTLI